jgi:hypothetical protein
MFGGTFLVALSYMMHARIEAKFDTILARLLIVFLALAQPWARGWARYFTWLKYKHTPQAVISAREEGVGSEASRGGVSRLDFWNEKGVGREALLTEVFSLLENEDWRYSADTGWKDWDVQIYGNQFWSITVRTVTEYHGGPKCLTRIHLRLKPVFTTVLLNTVILSILLYRAVIDRYTSPSFDMGLTGLLLKAAYLVFLISMFARARRLKRRVAALIVAAANRAGIERVFGKKSKPAPGRG